MLRKSEKLVEHLRTEWLKVLRSRENRPQELVEWFYGPVPPEGDAGLRDMRKLYQDSYLEGAVDMLELILSFDEEVHGAEALEELLKSVKAGEA